MADTLETESSEIRDKNKENELDKLLNGMKL